MVQEGQAALSARERQLLKLAAVGLTDTAIAQKLRIGEGTVSTYWRRIRTKVGPFSRTELVATLLRSECERIVAALVEENRMLLEKLRAEALNASKAEVYRGLIQTAPDAMLIVDYRGQIQMLNESAETLFGWTEADVARATCFRDRARPISRSARRAFKGLYRIATKARDGRSCGHSGLAPIGIRDAHRG